MNKIKRTPIVILNFKTYLESTGKNALKLAIASELVAEETGVNMVVAPQSPDIYSISNEVKIPVFAQHVDAVNSGGHTGSTLVECVEEAGAVGSLINHSEQRMKLADIDVVVKKTMEKNMVSVLCTNNIETSAAAATLKPDFVAIEPPELIGSGIPVSKAEPEIVEGTVDIIHEINPKIGVLCGAGISTGDDMKAALDLGAEGVLLASGIILAEDPKEALLNLVSKI
ncbi:triose-phosphate isomerase [Methanobacterium spitsbergense]|uniref:Triosephosphate isomerase n=1 Tax=Methanobacterium spitsbergense TaxID=2874285 RepID=A0A8T5V0A7_9EURY|nr:triose-phosphate isomerase [Methanobacterium spitsbergense]MBZ2165281.1 triose-phosphate isomerase [Methanobacterium spitsbergense]